MTKKLFILSAIALVLAAGVIMLKSSGQSAGWLWDISQNGSWFLPLVLVAALVDSINPCAFSILILTIAFLVSLGRLRPGILKIGLVYILGIFVIYLMIGLGILQTLHLFNTPHFMARIGAAALVLWGVLELVNEFFPSFPVRLRIPHAAHGAMARLMERVSVPTAFILGAFVGLCEFPCTGGPYLMILGMLHDTSTYLNGLGYLVLYNLVFILPLVVILLIASDRAVLEKVKTWRRDNTRAMRLWGGVAMIILGVLIFLL